MAARTRRLGDEEVGEVPLVRRVGVVASLEREAADSGEAVEDVIAVVAAGGVAEDARVKGLLASECEEPALHLRRSAAEARGAVALGAAGEEDAVALVLVEDDVGPIPDDVRDVGGIEVGVAAACVFDAGGGAVAFVAKGEGDAGGFDKRVRLHA